MTASEHKVERHTAIRSLLAAGELGSQDELRRKLVRKGYRVTQATLSRDIRELQLVKSSAGYALPGASSSVQEADALPALEDMLAGFALRVQQAQNLLVLITLMGSAQPVAAALDQAALPEIVGTVAGDNTVLIVCQQKRTATGLATQLRQWIG